MFVPCDRPTVLIWKQTQLPPCDAFVAWRLFSLVRQSPLHAKKFGLSQGWEEEENRKKNLELLDDGAHSGGAAGNNPSLQTW